MTGSPPPAYLGVGGRLQAGPSPALVDTGFALEIADAPALHDGFALADIAHVLALADAGVLSARDAGLLLAPLLEVAAIPADEFPYDPSFGDAWSSRQRVLDSVAGPLAGWLWVGRPRREAARVALRIGLRGGVIDAHAALTELATSYLARARRHRDTVMSDFTYLQPAQPTSLGYILAGHLQPVLRHLDRLAAAYRWVNRSPAGAGGTTGTSLPIDRERLAARLGFEGVVEHARDAMWQTDGLVDLLGTLAAAAVEAGQVAADLEIWASPAFGFVELADEFCRVSALMPQKKNPYALAVVRQSAASLCGALAGLLSSLRTPTARTDHFLYAPGEIRRALATFSGSIRLLAGVVSTLRVDPVALSRSSSDPALYLGDLADEIVRAGLADRRSAHRLLGEAVRRAQAEGRSVEREDISEVAQREGVPIPAALLDSLGDPSAVLRTRTVQGGWARLGELLGTSGRALARHRAWRERTRAALEAAEAGLRTEATRRAARSAVKSDGRVGAASRKERKHRG